MELSALVTLLVIIAIIGVLVWLIVTYIPMPDGFKKVIYVIAIISLIIYLLTHFGLWNP